MMRAVTLAALAVWVVACGGSVTPPGSPPSEQPPGGPSLTAPTLTRHPVDATLVAPAAARFEVEARGSAPLRFQWRKDGAPLPGASSPVLHLPETSLAHEGSYDVVVSNEKGEVTSRPARLVVHRLPRLLAQPGDVTATVGTAASFSVEADGTPAPTYQWERNGVPVSGATSPTLSFAALRFQDAGQYRCAVTNAAGQVHSTAVTLLVEDLPPQELRYASLAATYVVGRALVPLAPSNGGGTITQYTVSPALPAGLVLGATSGLLSGTPTTETPETTYTVTGSNAKGSTQVALSLRTVLVPALTTPPASVTVTAPGPATFTVGVSGTAPLSYQWQRGGVAISGATEASYTLASTAVSDSGAQLRVVVSNPWGSVTSGAAVLTVREEPPRGLAYAEPSAVYTVGKAIPSNTPSSQGGRVASYSITPTLPSGLRLDTASGTLTGTPTVESAQTTYTVTARNSGGSTTATLSLRVIELPSLTTQPQSATVIAPAEAAFSVIARGTGPLSYQWERNGQPLPGATLAQYLLRPTAYTDSGAEFRVVVSSPWGSVTSSLAVLTVEPPLVAGMIFVPTTTVYPGPQRLPASVPPKPGATYAWSIVTPLYSQATATIVSGAGTNTVKLDIGRDTGPFILKVVVTDASGVLVQDQRPMNVTSNRWSLDWFGPVHTRAHHSAVTLNDGRVMIIGGRGKPGETSPSAELFDPLTGTWNTTLRYTNVRMGHASVALPSGEVLVFGGLDANNHGTRNVERYNPSTQTWPADTSLAVARANGTATLLKDGRVLVVGGYDATSQWSTAAELYDPVARTTGLTGSLASARSGHTATLLADGRVLVVGGGGSSRLASAELFDPATGLWSSAGAMLDARVGHTATLLANGKVLVAGGMSASGTRLQAAELYHPASNTWSVTGAMGIARSAHVQARLKDGRVLVMGTDGSNFGDPLTAELYNPATGTWARTGDMATRRHGHTASLLLDGRVLVRGGTNGSSFEQDTAEMYDGTTGTWTTLPVLTHRREPAATKLKNGQVLISGGRMPSGGIWTLLPTTELFDPATTSASVGPSMATPRAAHTATLLADGRVLVAGGTASISSTNSLPLSAHASAELYDPETRTWKPTGSLSAARLEHTATLLPGGKVLVVGGNTASDSLAGAELYDPATGAWSSAGTLATSRYRHAAVLLNNGKVMVVGGYSRGGGALKTAELYDPATNTWSAGPSMATPRDALTATLLPDGRVVAAGGINSLAFPYYQSSVEVYVPTWNEWRTVWPMNLGRYAHAAVLYGGYVLIIGGDRRDLQAETHVEFYNPPRDTWTSSSPLNFPRERHTATVLDDGRVLVVGDRRTFEIFR